MKTLLIDNYDSFTFNLYQYLAEVNGVEPLVVKNDQMTWAQVEKLEFDNIVLSPGPGRPELSRDFGICKDAIQNFKGPILGVCLGHQGLCHYFGGSVDYAARVMHGRLSDVIHDGTGLFEGIPSPFKVVRYHSLIGRSLGPDMEETATTYDGILMGLRHKSRPIWGVQFHPESICTDYGIKLLENFKTLSEAALGKDGARKFCQAATACAAPNFKAGKATPDRKASLEVKVRKLESFRDSERVFMELYGKSSSSYWLDSSLARPGNGRFAFMGDATGPLAQTITYDVNEGVITVKSAEGVKQIRESIFDYLNRALEERYAARPPALPFAFNLGWVGYLGYELKGDCGASKAHRSPYPDAGLFFADRAVVFDNQEKEMWLLCCNLPGQEAESKAWLDATAARILALAPSHPELPAKVMGPKMRPFHPHEDYADLIDAAKSEIRRGETYEVCLTNTYEGRGAIDPLSTYRYLRAQSPAPYSSFLKFSSLAVMSSSPERFLWIDTDGTVESKPIKGTTRRGETPEEDISLAHALQTSEKDRSENLMIVDLLRNDLGRVCEVGSVHVPKIFTIETYATVHQLVSTVRGTLRHDSTSVDAVRAAFPGGSMTGAPKIRTMEIIDRLEQRARGIYSGAIGFIALSGAVDLNIVIRTIVAKGDSVSFGVGGAIIDLSDTQGEIDECLLKAKGVLRAMNTTVDDATPVYAAPERERAIFPTNGVNTPNGPAE